MLHIYKFTMHCKGTNENEGIINSTAKL